MPPQSERSNFATGLAPRPAWVWTGSVSSHTAVYSSADMPLNDEQIQHGLRHLQRADPVMRSLIKQAGPYTLKLRRNRFHSLVSAIISQQISGSAARSIRQRLHDYFAPDKLSA